MFKLIAALGRLVVRMYVRESDRLERKAEAQSALADQLVLRASTQQIKSRDNMRLSIEIEKKADKLKAIL